MSRTTHPLPRWLRAGLAVSVLAALVALDLRFNLARTLFVGPAESQAASEEPLQVQGLPILRPGTLTLGGGESHRRRGRLPSTRPCPNRRPSTGS